MTTAITRRITRFGIELEMLPPTPDEDDRYCDSCDGDGYLSNEVEDFDEETGRYTYRTEDEPCDNCGGSGRVGEDTNYLGDTAVGVFREFDLTRHRELHSYHCNCGDCSYRRGQDSGVFAAQEDCTVGVEFVSRILSTGDQDVFDRLEEAVPAVWRATQWQPDGYESCGNHIHVGFAGADGQQRFLWDTVRAADGTLRALIGMFPDGFEHLASAGLGMMRSYNGSPRKTLKGYDGRIDGNGSLLRLREQTMEFRLWNTPRDAERIAFHVNASLAMTRWAFARYAGKGPERRTQLLDDVREDRMSEDETASGVISMLDPSFKNHAQHREWLTAALAS